MSETIYEKFRTVLTLNLSSVIQDLELMKSVLNMVDMTMSDFEISSKQLDLITVEQFPEVAKYFLASKGISNLSKGTLKQYRYKLSNFFATVKKSYLDVTANDIRIYLYNVKQEGNLADSYVDNIRVTLNTFFQWLVDNDYLTKNPCAKIEKIKYQVKQREALTPFLLEKVRYSCINIREKALVDFLFSTGCRASECMNVLLTDINWEHNSVIIQHGKGDKQRVVYFNDESKVSLKEYIDSRKDDNPYLWVSKRAPHHQLHSHALENIIRKIGQRIGVHIYPHKLRHTFATIGLHNGMPLDKLQVLMGHSNPKTTLIYAEQDKSQLQIEHQKAF